MMECIAEQTILSWAIMKEIYIKNCLHTNTSHLTAEHYHQHNYNKRHISYVATAIVNN